MQAYSIVRTIEALYRQVRRQHHYNGDKSFVENPNIGLVFSVEVSATNHGYEKDGHTHHKEWERRFFEQHTFILTSWHRVFALVTAYKLRDFPAVPSELWTNLSNHDCAYGDAIKSTLVDATWRANEYCFGFMPVNQMHDTTKDSGVDLVLDSPTFAGLVQFVEVEIMQDTERDQFGYWKKLTSVKALRTNISFEAKE